MESCGVFICTSRCHRRDTWSHPVLVPTGSGREKQKFSRTRASHKGPALPTPCATSTPVHCCHGAREHILDGTLTVYSAVADALLDGDDANMRRCSSVTAGGSAFCACARRRRVDDDFSVPNSVSRPRDFSSLRTCGVTGSRTMDQQQLATTGTTISAMMKITMRMPENSAAVASSPPDRGELQHDETQTGRSEHPVSGRTVVFPEQVTRHVDKILKLATESAGCRNADGSTSAAWNTLHTVLIVNTFGVAGETGRRSQQAQSTPVGAPAVTETRVHVPFS